MSSHSTPPHLTHTHTHTHAHAHTHTHAHPPPTQVALISKDLWSNDSVTVNVTLPRGDAVASLLRLEAADMRANATQGVTWAGQSFAGAKDCIARGARREEKILGVTPTDGEGWCSR